jgi:RimJ/RimL family protein N-acetyltransferase
MPAWLDLPLVGELIRLRRPAAGDEPALMESMTDERVRRFIGGPVDAATASEKASRKAKDRVWGQFVIVDRVTDEVAGSGSLERKRGPWEISYLLLPAFWGRGFATETVLLVRTWFFLTMTEDLLIATTRRANDRSQRVLERAGAHFTGTFQQYGFTQMRYEFYRSESR